MFIRKKSCDQGEPQLLKAGCVFWKKEDVNRNGLFYPSRDGSDIMTLARHLLNERINFVCFRINFILMLFQCKVG